MKPIPDMEERLLDKIKELALNFSGLKFMEVCGTHTVSIYRNGIPSILPPGIDLISGPGCPVCVTETEFIDKAIEYLKRGYKILTFGDMLRVPGSESSLNKECSEDVKIVYSPLDALDYALENKKEKVIFLAVGFETTSPLIAATVDEAKKNEADNFFILSSLRLMPPALRCLLDSQEVDIDGLILPGHVAVITGTEDFENIADEYEIPSVVSGFEALDIMESVYLLLHMLKNKKEKFALQYKRVVKKEGNILAQEKMYRVFGIVDIDWRGLGTIPQSGLRLRDEYKKFDIEEVEPLKIKSVLENPACRCSDVIKGVIKPVECPLFDNGCSPETPFGPCMVSSEGSCSAYYKYFRD